MSGPQPYRHLELLDFIRSEMKAHGIPPSFGEMQVHLGVTSKSVIAKMLWRLETLGHIRRRAQRERGIELLQTKDYHLPNCACGACAQARYIAQLKLIQGLKVDPPAAVSKARMVGIRLLSSETRTALLGIPDAAVSRKRPAIPAGAL